MPIRQPLYEYQAGTTYHKSFCIALDTFPLINCVSITKEDTTIIIPRDLLDELSADSPEEWYMKDPRTEQEQIAGVRGDRARKLLKSLTKSTDKYGCMVVQSPVPDDVLYIVHDLLSSGQVAIMDNESDQRISHVIANYSGTQDGSLCGSGDISYSIETKSKPFLFLNLWVS